MTDYVEGKAAWLAEGLPAEGKVRPDERIGSRVTPSEGRKVLDAPGAPWTVRPNELVRDVLDRVADDGDQAPEVVHVTTAKGLLLGTVEVAALGRPAVTASAGP